eukprot:766989-Rhodomonas_salina.1
MEMLAFAWIAFFMHGLTTYLFVRPDATAYSEFNASVEGFNSMIYNFLDEHRHCFDDVGLTAKSYGLHGVTLQNKRELAAEDVQERFPERNCKALIQCRLLQVQARNVEKA